MIAPAAGVIRGQGRHACLIGRWQVASLSSPA
jgi:hypothetical protein